MLSANSQCGWQSGDNTSKFPAHSPVDNLDLNPGQKLPNKKEVAPSTDCENVNKYIICRNTYI